MAWRGPSLRSGNCFPGAQCSGAKIKPRDLAATRRYGIFALPELARQIKRHNSKHAFTAHLVIVKDFPQCLAYLDSSDQQFTTREAKLEHLKTKFEKLKAGGGGNLDVMKRISAALEE